MEKNQEEKQQGKKLKDLLKLSWLDIIILAVFVLLIFLVFQLTNQGNSCIKNPFVYGAMEVTDNNNDLMCSCYFTDRAYSSFTFNKEGIEHQVEIPAIPGVNIYEQFFPNDSVE